VTKPSPRRIMITMALFVVMLAVLVGSAQRETTTPLPLPPAARSSSPSVVEGRLPADKTIRAREGQVVRIDVQAVTPDVAEIFDLAVSAPVGPGLDAPLEFVADQPGRFDVTLRYSGERVGQLVVAPATTS
jgi:hypothetical protein